MQIKRHRDIGPSRTPVPTINENHSRMEHNARCHNQIPSALTAVAESVAFSLAFPSGEGGPLVQCLRSKLEVERSETLWIEEKKLVCVEFLLIRRHTPPPSLQGKANQS